MRQHPVSNRIKDVKSACFILLPLLQSSLFLFLLQVVGSCVSRSFRSFRCPLTRSGTPAAPVQSGSEMHQHLWCKPVNRLRSSKTKEALCEEQQRSINQAASIIREGSIRNHVSKKATEPKEPITTAYIAQQSYPNQLWLLLSACCGGPKSDTTSSSHLQRTRRNNTNLRMHTWGCETHRLEFGEISFDML